MMNLVSDDLNDFLVSGKSVVFLLKVMTLEESKKKKQIRGRKRNGKGGEVE